MAWNGSSNGAASVPSKPTAKAPSKTRGLVALALVVVLGGVAAYFFIGRKTPTAPREKGKAAPALIAETKPAVVSPARTNAQVKVPAKPAAKEKPPFVKRPGAMQLPDGQVLTFPAPKEGETRKVYAYGHLYECDHLGNFRDLTTRQLYKTAFEANFLALATQGRSFIPAFLTGLDQEEVKKILLKDYQPIGDETPEEMTQLKNYFDLKCAALDYMEQGGKFDDFVNDIVKFEKDQKLTQAASLREIVSLCKEGKVAEAREMAEAAADLMEKKGYQPLRLPPRLREFLGAAPRNAQ